MEKPFNQYRHDLAESIVKAPKEERKGILNEAKAEGEYWTAREEKIKNNPKIAKKVSEKIEEIKASLARFGGEEEGTGVKSIDKEEAKTWSSVEQKIAMPHINGISKKVEDRYKQEGRKDFDSGIVKDILYCFLEKGIGNTRMFNSEKHEASFPYTTVNTAEIAKSLYRAYSGREIGELKPSGKNGESGNKRLEFLFGSFQLVSHGNQFTFTEEILHQIFKNLPSALEKIENGEEPDSSEVCVLGSPTTLTGSISPKFAEEVKDHAFESYGDMYAELISSMVAKENDSKTGGTNIVLYGISMGASLAGQTAKRILEDGVVTQTREGEEGTNLPFMQVRIDTAPGHRNKPDLWSKVKLFGGFAAQTIYTLATDSYTRDVIFKNGKYMDQVNGLLAEKGLTKSNVSPEQLSMKKKVISLVENELAQGVPWPDGVKATEVVGLQDALTYDPKLNEDAYRQREENPDSLGTHSIKGQGNDDIRVRGAKMTHAIPFTQRENEIGRMYRATSSLGELKKKYS